MAVPSNELGGFPVETSHEAKRQVDVALRLMRGERLRWCPEGGACSHRLQTGTTWSREAGP